MARPHLLLVTALLALSGPAGAVEGPMAQVASVSDLASLREGVFTTAPAAEDPTGQGTTTKPALYDLAKRVEAPGLGRDVVYDELREGGMEGKILRQSLLAFRLDGDSGEIAMTRYSVGDGHELAGVYANPAPLAKINPPDLKPEAPGCDVIWRKTEDGFGGDFQAGCKGEHAAGSDSQEPAFSVSKTGLILPQDGGSGAMTLRRVR